MQDMSRSILSKKRFSQVSLSEIQNLDHFASSRLSHINNVAGENNLLGNLSSSSNHSHMDLVKEHEK